VEARQKDKCHPVLKDQTAYGSSSSHSEQECRQFKSSSSLIPFDHELNSPINYSTKTTFPLKQRIKNLQKNLVTKIYESVNNPEERYREYRKQVLEEHKRRELQRKKRQITLAKLSKSNNSFTQIINPYSSSYLSSNLYEDNNELIGSESCQLSKSNTSFTQIINPYSSSYLSSNLYEDNNELIGSESCQLSKSCREKYDTFKDSNEITNFLSESYKIFENMLDTRSRKKAVKLPQNEKDDAYWERRRKNNESAKRSREARRAKEIEIAIRASYLEQENVILRNQVDRQYREISSLKK
ncbi:protein giant-like protein, partial [Dinothrombium tinctorium]